MHAGSAGSRCSRWFGLLCCCVVLGLNGCGTRGESPTPRATESKTNWPQKLSEYGLFQGNGSTQEPVAGVIPYDLNTPLFSDYTLKYRFVKLPDGTKVSYHPTQEFDFPVGTLIAKTFAYPADLRDPSQGQKLLETRILKREPKGWIGLPYVWNADQTEATLEITGGTLDVSWIHTDGQERHNNYIIPNVNQCKGCHKTRSKSMLPIGPTARNFNRDFVYAGGSENQLAHWTRIGAMQGAPPPDQAPKLAVWDDPTTGTLDQRARAWLEVNCSHCHNPQGPARNSGLNLLSADLQRYDYGVYRAPVAAGAGSGGRLYDIVPGKPDQSILLYRISSTHPGVMMPELGKRLVHEEGVALIREWITAMTPEQPKAVN